MGLEDVMFLSVSNEDIVLLFFSSPHVHFLVHLCIGVTLQWIIFLTWPCIQVWLNLVYAPKNLMFILLWPHLLYMYWIKVTKFLRRSKFDIFQNYFDNMVVGDVKYLPFAFNGDVLFIHLHLDLAYVNFMNGMDKVHDEHVWCTTKTTNTQIGFGLIFQRSSCIGYLQCANDTSKYLLPNGAYYNNTKWIVVGSTSRKTLPQKTEAKIGYGFFD